MRRRLLVVGLLVVCMAMLSGCDFLDQLLDQISGGGTGGPGGGTPGGGTTTSGPITSVKIEYTLEANISERLMFAHPYTTAPGSIVTVFGPRTGTYDSVTKTFTATSWDSAVGNFSNTLMVVQLNETEEYVESFHARRTQSNVWFAWTFVNEIEGIHILDRHGLETDNPRTYEVDGVQVQDIVTKLIYKGWAREGEGYGVNDPIEKINSKADIIPSLNNIITITVYR